MHGESDRDTIRTYIADMAEQSNQTEIWTVMRLVGWGAWCLTRSAELAIAADLHPEDALAPADIDAMLTQSGVFAAVYCWSRDDATTIEMMVPLR